MIRIDEANKAILRTSLWGVMEAWINKSNEADTWPGHWTGGQTALMMADAALAVLWATAEAQADALQEEIYKEV